MTRYECTDRDEDFAAALDAYEKVILSGNATTEDRIYAGNDFGVTLRQNQRDYFYNRLDEICPNLKYQYIKSYGNAYECMSSNKNLWNVFKAECQKNHILYRMEDIVENIKSSFTYQQMDLFH